MAFSTIPDRINGIEILNTWFNQLKQAGLALENGIIPFIPFVIANNQAVAANVTGLSFDGVSYTSIKIQIEIRRSDATPTEAAAVMDLVLTYKSSGWELNQNEQGDDTGVIFSVATTGTIGQVKYTSTNYTGGSYSGTMKYFISKFGV